MSQFIKSKISSYDSGYLNFSCNSAQIVKFVFNFSVETCTVSLLIISFYHFPVVFKVTISLFNNSLGFTVYY